MSQIPPPSLSRRLHLYAHPGVLLAPFMAASPGDKAGSALSKGAGNLFPFQAKGGEERLPGRTATITGAWGICLGESTPHQ